MEMKHKQTYRIDAAQPFIRFAVERESEWLAFRFAFAESMTWGELHVVDPLGQERFLFCDVHSPREGMVHRRPEWNSYLAVPGPVPAGLWTIEFIRLMPQSFTLEWEYGSGDMPSGTSLPPPERDCWTDGQSPDGRHVSLNLYDWKQCREDAERWYKGDFHVHTMLSDGKFDPGQLSELAGQAGLDFFVITDHNVLSSSWPRSNVLVIPGVEVTSYHRGDWNIFGPVQTMDFRSVRPGTSRPSEEEYTAKQRLLREKAGLQGAIRSLNHPLVGTFSWKGMGTLLSDVDALEIWQFPVRRRYIPANEGALLLWSTLWNAGYPIPGIGGSDFHDMDKHPREEDAGDPLPSIGDPVTCVLAERLSPEAILRAVRQRRVYVSRGPVLGASYEVGGKQFHVGDDLTEAVRSGDGRVVGRLDAEAPAGSVVQLIVDGRQTAAHPHAGGRQTAEFVLDWDGASYVWTRFEVRDSDGLLLAVTNPVFCGSKQPDLFTWQQLLDRANDSNPAIKEMVIHI